MALDASLSPTIARKFLPRVEVVRDRGPAQRPRDPGQRHPFSRFKLIGQPGRVGDGTS